MYARTHYYHPACLVEAAANPEKYGHRKVDMAIHIFDIKKQKKEKMKVEAADQAKAYDDIREHLAALLTQNDLYQKEYEKKNVENS